MIETKNKKRFFYMKQRNCQFINVITFSGRLKYKILYFIGPFRLDCRYSIHAYLVLLRFDLFDEFVEILCTESLSPSFFHQHVFTFVSLCHITSTI